MGLLAWTFSCLLLLALLSWEFFASSASHHLVNEYIASHITQEADLWMNQLVIDDMKIFYDKSETPIPPPTRRKASSHDPRHKLSSKLHISPATFQSLPTQIGISAPSSPHERILFSLLSQHYPGIGLFQDKKDSETLARLLDTLAESFTRYTGKCSYKDAKILANFELGDQSMQEPFWQMLRGQKETGETWSSLLSLISFQQSKTITSLWLAPEPILRAIFEDKEEKIEEFMETRRSLYTKLRRAKKGEVDPRASVEADFRTMCEEMLPSWLPANLVDMGVSTTLPPSGNSKK